MNAPWLSVLLPTYNGARYLRHALESIVAQGVDGVECIVVDDGSTDDTVSIARGYRDRIDLEVVERPRRGNWVANTNVALHRARGRHASILHQDDCWAEGRLATMRGLVERHPDAGFFFHAAEFIDSRGDGLGLWRAPLPAARQVLEPEKVVPRLLVQNFIAIPAPVFKLDRAREMGALDETLRYTADWDLWLKLAAADKTVYHPDPLCRFRVHADAQTAGLSRDLAEFGAQQRIVLERHRSRAEGLHSSIPEYCRAGRFSIAMNTALAARYHGRPARLPALVAAFLRLGPLGWYRYLSCSRLWERASARIRARRRSARGDASPGSGGASPKVGPDPAF